MDKSIHPQYITDEYGERVSVVLPIHQWQQIVNDLEELENIRIYDHVKIHNEPTQQLAKYLISDQQINIDAFKKLESSEEVSKLRIWQDCSTVLMFTSKGNVYKIDNKGYRSEKKLKQKVELESKEKCIAVIGITDDCDDCYLILGFKNGCVVKINTNSYLTNRKKLSKAFVGETCVFIRQFSDDTDLVAVSSIKKVVVFNSSRLRISGRGSHGIQIMKLKENTYLESIKELKEVRLANPEYYRRHSSASGYELRGLDDLNPDLDEL